MEEINIKLFTKNERRCYNFYCEEGMPMRECMPDESLRCPQKHTLHSNNDLYYFIIILLVVVVLYYLLIISNYYLLLQHI